MSAPAVLVSHALCPYVQRAAIVMAEKGVAFERRDIDLAHKPDWFLRLSPTGKTPMLLVGGEALFESAAICEYLDETALPRLHPGNALRRARHRAWIEYASGVLNQIASFYNAAGEEALQRGAAELRERFGRVEAALADGPYFDGDFSLVDAAFAPVFRYLDVFEDIADFGIVEGLPKLATWRRALAARPSVRGAAPRDYDELLRVFLLRRDAALARRMRDLASPGEPPAPRTRTTGAMDTDCPEGRVRESADMRVAPAAESCAHGR